MEKLIKDITTKIFNWLIHRRVEAAQKEAASFIDLKGSYDIIKCDLADLQSVRGFSEAFLKKYHRLDGLMCNAGMVAMESDIQYTNDGYEKHLESTF